MAGLLSATLVAASAPAQAQPSAERPSGAGGAPPAFVPHRVLVAPAPGSGPEALAEVHARIGGRVLGVLPGTRVREVGLPRGVGVLEAVSRYERSRSVRFAEPDFLLHPTAARYPDDPGFGHLYGLHNTGQSGGTADADIDAPEAWGVATGRPKTVVAVIDTGVDLRHPDLALNRWTNPGEVAGNKVDDDGNGYVDDVHGWDFYHGDNTVADGYEDDHGTHVAGTIAAVGDNGIGVTGVAWRAQVMSLKFLGPDGGATSDAIAALDYAVEQGARISNNSWGSPYYSRSLADAIERAADAGHLFVAAAGNGGADGVGDDNDVTPDYPASYASANIVSVAASNHSDSLAAFSNYGATTVDLAAPGVDVLSTVYNDVYSSYSGTSMAAPHVTGAAALLQSRRPGITATGLKRRLLQTVDQRASLHRTVTGGRLNVGQALDFTASAVTLSGTPSTLTYGRSATLSGRLSLEDLPPGGRTVVLEQRPVGTYGWTAVPGGTVTTADDGGFSVPGVAPERSTDYRARYAGTLDIDPAVSPTVRTGVRVRVALWMRETDLRLGRARVLSGEVSPWHAGSVRVVIRRNGVVLDRRKVTLDDSTYRLTYRPPRPGRYTVTTRRHADEDHLGASSVTKGFRVVR